MKINKKIIWLLVILWSLFIGYFSLVHEEEVPGAATVGTNLLHLPSYFLLSWLYFNAFGKDSKKAVYLSVVSAFAYGVLLEILQFFTGYRHFSFMDMGVNLAGAVLAPVIAKGYEYGSKRLA